MHTSQVSSVVFLVLLVARTAPVTRAADVKPRQANLHQYLERHSVSAGRRLRQATASASAGSASASAGSSSAFAGPSGASTSTAASGGSAAAADTSSSSSSTYLNVLPTSSVSTVKSPFSSSASSSSSSSASAAASDDVVPVSPVPDKPTKTKKPGKVDVVEDIFDTLESALEAFPELSIFLELLKEILGPELSNLGDILTLLAPTDAAFEALAETLGKSLKELLKLPIIKKIVLYHILPEIKQLAEFAIGEFVQTLLQGEKGIKVDIIEAITEILPTGGPAANVLKKDIQAGEAILHIIGGVLIPTSKVSELEKLLQLGESLLGSSEPEAAGR